MHYRAIILSGRKTKRAFAVGSCCLELRLLTTINTYHNTENMNDETYHGREDSSIMEVQPKAPNTENLHRKPSLPVTDGYFESNESFPRFTLFPDLPAELQLKIWHISTTVPRLIELQLVPKEVLCCREGHQDEESRVKEMPHLRPKTNNPAILRTCRASRSVALKIYKSGKTGHKIYRRIVYLNPQEDTLFLKSDLIWYISAKMWQMRPGVPLVSEGWTLSEGWTWWHSQLDLFEETLVKSVKTIALDVTLLLEFKSDHWLFITRLALAFRPFETVILVLNDARPVSSENNSHLISLHDPQSEIHVDTLLAEKRHMVAALMTNWLKIIDPPMKVPTVYH